MHSTHTNLIPSSLIGNSDRSPYSGSEEVRGRQTSVLRLSRRALVSAGRASDQVRSKRKDPGACGDAWAT